MYFLQVLHTQDKFSPVSGESCSDSCLRSPTIDGLESTNGWWQDSMWPSDRRGSKKLPLTTFYNPAWSSSHISWIIAISHWRMQLLHHMDLGVKKFIDLFFLNMVTTAMVLLALNQCFIYHNKRPHFRLEDRGIKDLIFYGPLRLAFVGLGEHSRIWPRFRLWFHILPFPLPAEPLTARKSFLDASDFFLQHVDYISLQPSLAPTLAFGRIWDWVLSSESRARIAIAEQWNHQVCLKMIASGV